ncbi:unnamed protein product [Discosporangium mesarthrocarpum]
MAREGKRPRPKERESDQKLTALLDMHQVGYWTQWHLALNGACARFNAATEAVAETGARRREESDPHRDYKTRQQELNAEIRHLQAQLGKQASENGKLEAEILKIQEARGSDSASVARLEAQLAEQSRKTVNTTAGLNARVCLLEGTCQRLQTEVSQAVAARDEATRRVAALSRIEAGLREALNKEQQVAKSLKQEAESYQAKQASAEAREASLREKYSGLKRRMVEAGKKVESLRAEREVLRGERASLEDKLADVEKFQRSERGVALNRMEQVSVRVVYPSQDELDESIGRFLIVGYDTPPWQAFAVHAVLPCMFSGAIQAQKFGSWACSCLLIATEHFGSASI